MNSEQQLIVETAKKYVYAFRECNPLLIDEHFEKDAFKMGYFYDFDNKKWMDKAMHDFDQMRQWTTSYNADAIMPHTDIPARLLDHQSHTAVVHLFADWAPGVRGSDYVLLSKKEDGWRISCVFWQTVL